MQGTISSTERRLAELRGEDRIRRHTAPYVNLRIDQLTSARVRACAEAGHDAMVVRLRDLDREWDLERVLLAGLAATGAAALLLGREVHRGWLRLLGAQQAFLAMQAIVGWSPPVALLRRLGVRTGKEIAAERAAILEGLAARPA